MSEPTAQGTIEQYRKQILDEVDACRGSGRNVAELAESAVAVTECLHRLCRLLEQKPDREQRLRLARMVDDPAGCAFTTLFTDRVPRALGPAAAVRTGQMLLQQLGAPEFLGTGERVLLRAFGAFGPLQPTLAAAGVKRHIQKETSRYLLSDAVPVLSERLQAMQATGVSVNVNHLGEEILSAGEAEMHLAAYERLLSLPEVNTVSVKISSICERLSTVAFDESVERIAHALRRIYRAAGSGDDAKLVMLDMEAYKDLTLSVASFKLVAGEPEFAGHRVGIVLQAYIPDSHAVQDDIFQWAKARVAAGGRPVRVRLVKGANLAMERVLEEERGWVNPVYPSKLEVDASFKHMLEKGAHSEHRDYIVQGVGSHNLFDVALTLLLRSSLGGESHVSFEILAGMAEPLRRTLALLNLPTLVYCPTVSADAYHTAVAYLVRRLDENTTPGNFLCSGFGMEFGDAAWHDQRQQFLAAANHSAVVSTESRRRARLPQGVSTLATPFVNVPDVDFCVAEERQNLRAAIAALRAAPCAQLKLSVAGGWCERPGPAGFDPSDPASEPYRIAEATSEDVERALSSGDDSRKSLAAVPLPERARWLLAVAEKFREHRFELIARTMQDGGKVAIEADAEVSEAIDFAEYYARSAMAHAALHEVRLKPRGVTVVTPPWNFPLAIPLGGCFAALVSGNPVILKPAYETPAIATRAVELCYEAGIPQQFLQLLVATDAVATPLITDKRVRSVILTGASDTARLFRRLRPAIHLLAETGGKNTLIVTEHADLDVAVSAAADSAFGHSGQKCSAVSLLILQAAVVKSGHFLERLVAATQSRRVGSVWDLNSEQGPLIHPPAGALKRAIDESTTGAGWALKPTQDPDNPRLVSPGICDNVGAGSFLHQTELFGPVLGVMRAPGLDSALKLANATPYGLTAGLISMDEAEQRQFLRQMDAGNLYINRATTGAVVERQPFGGRKTSSFGPGAKAGGPNYLLELVLASDRGNPVGAELPPVLRHALAPVAEWLPPEQRDAFWAASASYQRAFRDHFAPDHDPAGLPSQRNVFRYQPAEGVLLWLGREVPPLDLALVLSAVVHSQVRFDLALTEAAPGLVNVAKLLPGSLGRVVGVLDPEGDHREVFAQYRRVRCVGVFPNSVHRAKNSSDAYFERAAPMRCGRIELLRYFQEQSISAEVHRHGNLQAAVLSPLGASPPGHGATPAAARPRDVSAEVSAVAST